MHQKRLVALLRKLNKSAITPFGKIPLDRLVSKNLGDLSILRALGITWPSITRALLDWRRDNERPLSVDHLRSAYSRARRLKESHIAPTPPTVSKSQVQNIERGTPMSPVPVIALSTKENPNTASRPSKLREQMGRTLHRRYIEED